MRADLVVRRPRSSIVFYCTKDKGCYEMKEIQATEGAEEETLSAISPNTN